jgi:hypothetical protein
VVVRRGNAAVVLGVLLAMNRASLAAGPSDETFETVWSSFGRQVEADLAALPAKGRAAFERTLVGCSVFVVMYSNPKYTSECEAGANEFLSQFSDTSSPLFIVFRRAIDLTRAYNMQTELEQGRDRIVFDNPGRVYIEVLRRAYRGAIPREF